MMLGDVIAQSVLSPKACQIVACIEGYTERYQDGPTTKEVAKALGLTVSCVNYYLRELRGAGMLESR